MSPLADYNLEKKSGVGGGRGRKGDFVACAPMAGPIELSSDESEGEKEGRLGLQILGFEREIVKSGGESEGINH